MVKKVGWLGELLKEASEGDEVKKEDIVPKKEHHHEHREHHSHAERVIEHQLEKEKLEQEYWSEQRELIRDELKRRLSEGTSNWKDKGDIDVKFELPKPLGQRVREVVNAAKKHGTVVAGVVKTHGSRVAGVVTDLTNKTLPKVKAGLSATNNKFASVVDSVKHKMKRTVHRDVEVVEKVVRDEWSVVEKRNEDSGVRDEIEKIYIQLNDKETDGKG